jgi:RimJ/RimL family protein N-acetyltransferase
MTTSLRGPRVTLRHWRDDDLAPFAALNADPEVMRHFVAPLTRAESDAMAARIRANFESRGFAPWALDVPGLGFTGFVGISVPMFELPLTGLREPVHEIGWRLARAAWGQGYASEAAALALTHAFGVLRLPEVVSFTATTNLASQAVMRRIGLRWRGEFEHPRIPEGHALRRHVLYAITAQPGPGADPAAGSTIAAR